MPANGMSARAGRVGGLKCVAAQSMMKDQYANYVVQKVLDLADARQQQRIVDMINGAAAQLRRYT